MYQLTADYILDLHNYRKSLINQHNFQSDTIGILQFTDPCPLLIRTHNNLVTNVKQMTLKLIFVTSVPSAQLC